MKDNFLETTIVPNVIIEIRGVRLTGGVKVDLGGVVCQREILILSEGMYPPILLQPSSLQVQPMSLDVQPRSL